MTDGADPLSELRAAWERAKFIPGVMVPPSLAWAILRVLGDVQEAGPGRRPPSAHRAPFV